MTRRKSGPRRPAPARPHSTSFVRTIVFGVAMIALVWLHTPYVNGPSYWMWGWQRLPFWRGWPLVVLAAVPFTAAQWWHAKSAVPTRARTAAALGGLMIAALILQLNTLVIAAGGRAPDRLWTIVEDSRVTSYYTDAQLSYNVIPSLKDWLALFPEFIGRLHIHSRNKPPGPMLYYLAFARSLPNDHQAASAAGVTIGLIATVAIPATFFFARAIGVGVTSSFFAASAMTLCPGLILFFPELDQTYAVASAMILGSWVLALRQQSTPWAIVCGVLLAFTLFFSFNVLVLGWFMAGAGWYLWRSRRLCGLDRLLVSSLIVLGIVAIVHLTLWLSLRYNVIATFEAGVANQASFNANVPRPYPQTAVFDLLDYALGLGWMSAWLFIGATTERSEDDEDARAWWWLATSQLVVIAIAAILAVETARVWIFLFPLALPFVGRELRRWTMRQRAAFFTVAFVTILAIAENMIFFSMAPAS